jgi:hypothetical protein
MTKRLEAVFECPMSLTIAELKNLIKNLPEVNEDDEPYLVFIETGDCLSSVVTSVWPLNKREDGSDILFVSNAFEEQS